MLSAEHKMLLWRGYKGKGYKQFIQTAYDVFHEHNKKTKSNRAIKTVFQFSQNDLPISDEMIRVLVMVSADGRVRYNQNQSLFYIELHFRKQRKIQRAQKLLNDASIPYTIKTQKDGSTVIYASTSHPVTKSLLPFYKASARQLNIIRNEIYHWDGTIDKTRNHKFFSSTDKNNADVIQFAHAVNGIRAGISTIHSDKDKYPNYKTVYSVYETQNPYVGFPNYKFETVPSEDGYKYCFTTSTGFFIIRRNNYISITGNCGMHTIQMKESELDLPLLDTIIKK